MQNFIQTFGDLVEFEFIDGPFEVHNYEPLKVFVKKGFKPPFREWSQHPSEPYRARDDGELEMVINKTTTNSGDEAQSFNIILQQLNSKDEPYDGFIGFSNGFQAVKRFFKVAQYFKNSVDIKNPLPFFFINFNQPTWDFQTFTYQNEKFLSSEHFVPGLESLQLKSEKDPNFSF